MPIEFFSTLKGLIILLVIVVVFADPNTDSQDLTQGLLKHFGTNQDVLGSIPHSTVDARASGKFVANNQHLNPTHHSADHQPASAALSPNGESMSVHKKLKIPLFMSYHKKYKKKQIHTKSALEAYNHFIAGDQLLSPAQHYTDNPPLSAGVNPNREFLLTNATLKTRLGKKKDAIAPYLDCEDGVYYYIGAVYEIQNYNFIVTDTGFKPYDPVQDKKLFDSFTFVHDLVEPSQRKGDYMSPDHKKTREDMHRQLLTMFHFKYLENYPIPTNNQFTQPLNQTILKNVKNEEKVKTEVKTEREMEIELRHSGEHDEEKSARHVHSEEKSASHEGGSPKLQNGNDREPGAEVLQYGDENSGGDQEAHSTEKNRHDPISTLLELTGDIRAKQIHEGSAWKAQNPGEHKNLTGDDQEAHSTENKTNDPISGVFDPTEHIRARQIHEESAWKAMQNRAQNHGEDEKSMTENQHLEPISKLDDLTKRIRSEQLQADSAKKFKENAENEAAEKIIESEKAKAAELGGNKNHEAENKIKVEQGLEEKRRVEKAERLARFKLNKEMMMKKYKDLNNHLKSKHDVDEKARKVQYGGKESHKHVHEENLENRVVNDNPAKQGENPETADKNLSITYGETANLNIEPEKNGVDAKNEDLKKDFLEHEESKDPSHAEKIHKLIRARQLREESELLKDAEEKVEKEKKEKRTLQAEEMAEHLSDLQKKEQKEMEHEKALKLEENKKETAPTGSIFDILPQKIHEKQVHANSANKVEEANSAKQAEKQKERLEAERRALEGAKHLGDLQNKEKKEMVHKKDENLYGEEQQEILEARKKAGTTGTIFDILPQKIQEKQIDADSAGKLEEANAEKEVKDLKKDENSRRQAILDLQAKMNKLIADEKEDREKEEKITPAKKTGGGKGIEKFGRARKNKNLEIEQKIKEEKLKAEEDKMKIRTEEILIAQRLGREKQEEKAKKDVEEKAQEAAAQLKLEEERKEREKIAEEIKEAEIAAAKRKILKGTPKSKTAELEALKSRIAPAKSLAEAIGEHFENKILVDHKAGANPVQVDPEFAEKLGRLHRAKEMHERSAKMAENSRKFAEIPEFKGVLAAKKEPVKEEIKVPKNHNSSFEDLHRAHLKKGFSKKGKSQEVAVSPKEVEKPLVPSPNPTKDVTDSKWWKNILRPVLKLTKEETNIMEKYVESIQKKMRSVTKAEKCY